MLLEVKDLDISYGDKLTVTGASLELDKGVHRWRVRQWQNHRYPRYYGLPARCRPC